MSRRSCIRLLVSPSSTHLLFPVRRYTNIGDNFQICLNHFQLLDHARSGALSGEQNTRVYALVYGDATSTLRLRF